MPVSRIRKALANPGAAFGLLWALAKGQYYKTILPFRGIRFSAGRNLRVFGKLTVSGPGRVIFGDDVIIGMHVTPFTHHRDAEIRVGNHCFLNGTRMGCQERIEIGDHCILAESRIMDTNFHSIRVDRWNPAAPVKTAPVVLEENVWIAAEAGLLPGTRIGRNSVVGFGSVCSGVFPSDVLIIGNPGKVIRPIEQANSAVEPHGTLSQASGIAAFS